MCQSARALMLKPASLFRCSTTSPEMAARPTITFPRATNGFSPAMGRPPACNWATRSPMPLTSRCASKTACMQARWTTTAAKPSWPLWGSSPPTKCGLVHRFINTTTFAARDFWSRRGASDAHTLQGSVRSERRRLGRKTPPPGGLRRFSVLASLLLGHSPTAGDAPSSRLARTENRRNKRGRIYETGYLVLVWIQQLALPAHQPGAVSRPVPRQGYKGSTAGDQAGINAELGRVSVAPLPQLFAALLFAGGHLPAGRTIKVRPLRARQCQRPLHRCERRVPTPLRKPPRQQRLNRAGMCRRRRQGDQRFVLEDEIRRTVGGHSLLIAPASK